MKIEKVEIQNFKGVGANVGVEFKHFNVIVGRNDAGKSTVLKALDHFLNDTSPKIEDLNTRAEDSCIRVTILLRPARVPVIIDQTVATTLEDEELTDEEGRLVLMKVWDTSKSKISAETFLFRKKYEGEFDFIPLTETALMKLCNNLGLATRKGNDEVYNNAEKRQKLREYYAANNFPFTWEFEKLPTSGAGRLKEIADAIKKLLPCFEYFKADTSLSETDTSIQHFFKRLAEQAIAEYDTSEIEKVVSAKIQAVLGNVTAKINQVVGIEDAVEPQIEFDWTKLIQTSFKSVNADGPIPLKSRGDGFRRITMMAYFEHLAEQEKSQHQNMIFGFEEPETFLHPMAQEKLFHKLKALCENDYQIIMSTHSPIIVALSQVNDLIHIHRQNGTYNVDQQLRNVLEIAFDLGIRPENQFIALFDRAKVLFLVEGIGDALAYNHVAKVYRDAGLIRDTLYDLGIITIPIGGCGSIKHWVALNLLHTLNKPFFFLLDSDKETDEQESQNRRLLERCGFVEGVDFGITKKRALENYIPPEALNRFVPGANLSYGNYDHVKKMVKNHPLCRHLGGDDVVEKHFNKLTFDDLRTTFYDQHEDEFMVIYSRLTELLDPTGRRNHVFNSSTSNAFELDIIRQEGQGSLGFILAGFRETGVSRSETTD